MQTNQRNNGNNRHDGGYPSPDDTRNFPAHRIIPPGTVNLADFKKDNGRQDTKGDDYPVILVDDYLA